MPTNIDETMMIAHLKSDARAENCEKLANGALLLMLDAFDRKVTRDQFIAAASSALTCCDNVGRVSITQSLVDHIQTHKMFSLVELEIMRDEVKDYLTHSTAQCLMMADLLTKCTNGDTIQ
jgi:hypothetical protein